MATGKTVFSTYRFLSEPFLLNESYGYTNAIHCGYITKNETDTITGKRLNLFFEDTTQFRFLKNASEIATGEGFTANAIEILFQVVDGIADENTVVEPDPAAWVVVDVTSQIDGYSASEPIDRNDLANTLFDVDLTLTAPLYDLSYLDYPTAVETDPINEASTATTDPSVNIFTPLTFGEEVFFFGNVNTDIKAVAYTTDIAINLPLFQFNSTTNPTWNGSSSVAVSEVGIYDDQGNLVAIGKLNYPLSKDTNVSRTIAFQIDF
jgi:hypothetical protein